MTEEEFKEEVRSFADLCLNDYPKSFEITFSVNDAGMDIETHSADILITMDNGTIWNIPISEDEAEDSVIESGDDYSLPMNAESLYAVLWFEAMDRMEEQRKSLIKLACLGNGDRYGNSEGNVIAIRALDLDPSEVYNHNPQA